MLDTSEAPLPGAQAPKEGLLKAADGGTLLLDEVCELNPSLQAKLLRAVEEGAVRHLGGRKPSPLDVRFLASTNGNIYGEMRQGRFHEDLFFRPGPPGQGRIAPDTDRLRRRHSGLHVSRTGPRSAPRCP